VLLEQLGRAGDHRHAVGHGERSPVTLGARRRLRRGGDRRRIRHAGDAEHFAGGGLDGLDRLGRVDPPVAEDLSGPLLLAEEILNGLFDSAHDTRSSTR
jgi:hypothetical protein